jgi:hypothetical protein
VARIPLRDALVCLSLANLYLLDVWIEFANRTHDYYMKVPPRWAMLFAAAADMVLLWVCLLVCVTLWRRFRSPGADIVACLAAGAALLVPLNILRTSVFGSTYAWLSGTLGRSTMLAAAGAIGLLALAFALRRPRRCLQVLAAFLLLLLPLLPVMAGTAIVSLALRSPDEAFASSVPLPDGRRGGPRLLWMLFDEWDQRLVFTARPRGLSLPAIDRLRAEALVAARAVGGGYGTANAVPSMFIGRRIAESAPAGPSELLVGINGEPSEGGDLEPISAHLSLFGRLRQHGWQTAVVDWYHPSCRVFAAQIDRCTWEPGASIYQRPEYAADLSFMSRMQLLAERRVQKAPMAASLGLVRPDTSRRLLGLQEFERIRAAASQALGTSDFVYVHWPIPHPLGIYDRQTGRMDLGTDATYLDNLALTDRVIAEIRTRLELLGTWDDAVVLLSSDHSLRTEEWMGRAAWSPEEQRATAGRRSPHVPFVLKLGRQREALTYNEPFSIMLTHDLVLALAKGELRTPAEVARWLDAHRGRFPLPREGADK